MAATSTGVGMKNGDGAAGGIDCRAIGARGRNISSPTRMTT